MAPKDLKTPAHNLVLKKPQNNRVSSSSKGPISYACQPSDFKCVSHPHTCVSPSMVCDGIHDCTDHSDEFNCPEDKNEPKFRRWKKHQPVLKHKKRRLLKARTKRYSTLRPQGQKFFNFGWLIFSFL